MLKTRGVRFFLSSAKIINNLISENLSYDAGAGIQCGNSSPMIINNTITLNNSQNIGGGASWHASFPVIFNTIFWANRTNNGDEISLNAGSSINISFSVVKDVWPGEGNISVDPLFVDPVNGDYRLSDNSLCIAAGTAIDAPVKDILGNDRGTPPDMGAYENPLPFSLTIISEIGDPQGAGIYKTGVEALWSVTTPWPGENGENGVRYVADTPSGSVIMNSNHTVTITWQPEYFLTINSEDGQGRELGNPTGQGWYKENLNADWSVVSPVMVHRNNQRYTADVSEGSMKMDSPKTITVDWKNQWYLDTQTSGGGSINLEPNWINDGEQVTVEAMNTANFTFSRWLSKSVNSSDQSTNNPWMLTMDRAKRVFAIFNVSGTAEPLSLTLKEGWNYFSLPHFPTTPVIEERLDNEILGTIWERRADSLDQTIVLKPRTGYWIYCRETTSIDMPGVLDTFSTTLLIPGWNFIGLTSNQSLPIGSSIAWYWDENGFKVRIPDEFGQ